MFRVSGLVAGCDPHLDTVTMAVIDPVLEGSERVVTVANGGDGWGRLVGLCREMGVGRVGVEGASGFGRGLATVLVDAGVEVIEVPTRLTARIRTIDGASKTDPGDAVAVARATARGEGSVWTYQPAAETVRVLTHRRQSLVAEQTRAINQLRALLIEVDPEMAAGLGRLGRSKQPFRILTETSFDTTNPHHQTIGWIINQLATDCLRRINQIRELETRLEAVMPPIGRAFQQIHGCGLISAAQLVSELAGTTFDTDAKLAAWNGTAPLDASSGRQHRHRLNRGGNRQANRAIHTIVITQHRTGGQAAHYINRRINEGLTRKEAIRAAKRHVTRRIWKILRDHQLT